MKITDDIFKSIFNESVWIPITFSLKFVPKGPIGYKSLGYPLPDSTIPLQSF